MKRKCKIGFPCGESCIAKNHKCWNNLPKEGGSKQFETFSQFVNRLVGIGNDNQSAIKNEDQIENLKDNVKELKKDLKSKTKKVKAAPKPVVEDFDIEQDLSNADPISQEDNGSIFDAEGIYILENEGDEISPVTIKVMEELNNLDFKHSPKVLGNTDTRVAMEKFEGLPLSAQRKNLDDDDRQNIMSALKDLHNAGISYGNINEDNIFYDKPTKKVTFTDFSNSETPDVTAYGKEQKPENHRRQMIDDVFNAQAILGKKENQEPKLERMYDLGLSGGLGDFKNASYRLNDNSQEVKSILRNEQKYNDFMEDLYLI